MFYLNIVYIICTINSNVTELNEYSTNIRRVPVSTKVLSINMSTCQRRTCNYTSGEELFVSYFSMKNTGRNWYVVYIVCCTSILE